MANYKYIGLIANHQPDMPIVLSTGSVAQGYKLKKVLAQAWYPGVEVVANLDDILNDEHIELIVVAGQSPNQLDIIQKATAAGKFVRVI
jgi:predicted dehydrogenase